MIDCEGGTVDVPYRDITSGQIKDLGDSLISEGWGFNIDIS